MDFDPGYKYIEKFCSGVQWYMMESNYIISTICFKVKNENSENLSFNGQSITFRLSIKEVEPDISEVLSYNYMSVLTK